MLRLSYACGILRLSVEKIQNWLEVSSIIPLWSSVRNTAVEGYSSAADRWTGDEV